MQKPWTLRHDRGRIWEIAAMDPIEPLIRFIMWMAVGWFGLGLFMLFYESIRPRGEAAPENGKSKEKVGRTIWKSSFCGGIVIACLWYIIHPSPGWGTLTQTAVVPSTKTTSAEGASAPAKTQGRSVQPAATPVAGSVGNSMVQVPGDKSVELTGFTNTLLRVGAQTATLLLPGETLRATMKYPDGRTEQGVTSWITHQRKDSESMYSGFSWTLPDSFGTNQAQLAVDQMASTNPSPTFVDQLIRKARGNPAPGNKSKRSRLLMLQPGRPLPIFTVTDDSGAVVTGYLEFTRAAPQSDADGKIEATVQINDPGIPMQHMMIFYSATVPPGYALEVGGSGTGAGSVDISTSRGYSKYSMPWSSSWLLPRSFGDEEVKAGLAQVKLLSNKGKMHVPFGKPVVIFSITNNAGEVFEGVFDLKGPRPDERK